MKSETPPISSLVALLLEAGALARTMQSHVSLSVKPDGTVVTEADVSVHAMMCKALQKLTPEIPVISEEQAAEKNIALLAEPRFWTLDPIDVTANYAAGGNAYSINLALVQQGVPMLGLLLFPGLEELYYTGDDRKAYKQFSRETPRAIHVAPLQDGLQTAALRPDTHATHAPVSEHTLKVIFTRGQRRACLVATGEATFCSERAGFRIWDSAATFAIVTAAGGAVEQHDGSPILYDKALELPPYFVGHPELLRHLHMVRPERPINEILIDSTKRKKA